MTDVWTLGLHRRWKRQAMMLAALKPGERVLDVCTGTGDMVRLAKEHVAPTGLVVGIDYTLAMLQVGKRRVGQGACLLCGDARTIALLNEQFDIVMVAFGLRNVSESAVALKDIHRVLRPGGRLVILDFSTPEGAILGAVHLLFYQVLMKHLGWALAFHTDAHHYMRDSMQRWPRQRALSDHLRETGYTSVHCASLAGGFAAVHRGWKP